MVAVAVVALPSSSLLPPPPAGSCLTEAEAAPGASTGTDTGMDWPDLRAMVRPTKDSPD